VTTSDDGNSIRGTNRITPVATTPIARGEGNVNFSANRLARRCSHAPTMKLPRGGFESSIRTFET